MDILGGDSLVLSNFKIICQSLKSIFKSFMHRINSTFKGIYYLSEYDLGVRNIGKWNVPGLCTYGTDK